MILKPNANATPLEDVSLEALQKTVGGYIECVALPPLAPDTREIVMVVNEEGKLMRLPMNPVATYIMMHVVGVLDMIVGPAAFVAADDEGAFHPLDEHERQLVMELFVEDLNRTLFQMHFEDTAAGL